MYLITFIDNKHYLLYKYSKHESIWLLLWRFWRTSEHPFMKHNKILWIFQLHETLEALSYAVWQIRNYLGLLLLLHQQKLYTKIFLWVKNMPICSTDVRVYMHIEWGSEIRSLGVTWDDHSEQMLIPGLYSLKQLTVDAPHSSIIPWNI